MKEYKRYTVVFYDRFFRRFHFDTNNYMEAWNYYLKNKKSYVRGSITDNNNAEIFEDFGFGD